MRTSANLWPRTAVLITVTLVMALSSASSNVSATPDVLELEAERRWTSGTNPTIEDLAIAELVGGGLPEIVSVGGTGTSGEIRVQRYTGSTFFDVVSPVYPVETAKGVATGNLDADPLGVTEIVSVGCGSTTGDISLWVLSGGALNRVPGSQLSVPDTCFHDVTVSNLDADASIEVIVTGYSPSLHLSRLEVRSWNGAAWTTKASTTFDVGYDTVAYAVAMGELDGQPPIEIVTSGGRKPTPSSPSDGQVAVWHYSGGILTKVGDRLVTGGTQQGVTMWDVAVGDPDNDLAPEVLAVGSQDWLTTNAASQLHTYVLTPGGAFNQESQESRAGEYWLSVAMGDIDNDGQIESVVAGQESTPSGGTYGALAVVRAVGTGFVHELDRYRWLSVTYPWSTVVGNPDGDLVTEFLTGSQRSPVDNAAELRAWNWNVPPKPDDSWPQFQRDTSHTGFSASTAPNTNALAWSQSSLVGGCYQHDRYSPVTYDGKVFIAVTGTIRAFLLDGTPVWPSPVTIQDSFLGPTARSLAAGAGRVYYGAGVAGTPSFGVLASYQSSDGSLVWAKGSETFSRQFVFAPPVLSGDRIVVGTVGDNAAPPAPPGKVFAFDNNGNTVWTFSSGGDVLASQAIAGTKVYVRTGTELYSIPLDDPDGDGVISNPGQIDWKFSMGTWSGSRYALALVGSPAVAGNFVYIGSHDGYLYKVPRTDPTPGDKTMTLADLSTGGGWRSQLLGGWVASTPVVSQGAVYVGADSATSGRLYRLDDSSGIATWLVDFYRLGVSAPVVAAGKVFIMNRPTSTPSHNVSAYNATSGSLLWSKLVHSQSSNSSIGGSMALTGGYLFASNGFQDCSATYPGDSIAYLFAIKDP